VGDNLKVSQLKYLRTPLTVLQLLLSCPPAQTMDPLLLPLDSESRPPFKVMTAFPRLPRSPRLEIEIMCAK
jgi:hypothetical protein